MNAPMVAEQANVLHRLTNGLKQELVKSPDNIDGLNSNFSNLRQECNNRKSEFSNYMQEELRKNNQAIMKQMQETEMKLP